MEIRNKWVKIFMHVMLIMASVATLLPLVWMVSTSFKEMEDVFTIPIQWIPVHFKVDNYSAVFETIQFGRYYVNTILVTLGRVLGLLATATLAGYAFAKIKFPGKKILFMCLLMTLMVPIYAILYPVYKVVAGMDFINTYRGLIIPQALGAFGGAFSIFLIKQGFESVPDELAEAAKIDGAGVLRTFFSVMLPQIKPVLSSFLILSFNAAWNDYVYPLLVVNKDEMKTLSLGLAQFTSMREGVIRYPLLMAAATMTLVPIIIVFVLAQKNFIESTVSSGLKG